MPSNMNHDYIKLSFGDKVRFKCLRCGRCCSSGPNVGLTAFDICRIARFLDLDWRELKGKYVIAVIADMIAIPTLRDKGRREMRIPRIYRRTAFMQRLPSPPHEVQAIPVLTIKSKQKRSDIHG